MLCAPFAFTANRYDQHAMAFEINVGYKYLQRFMNGVSMGGFFNYDQNMQEYKDWDEFHMYWLNVYEIGFAAMLSKKYNEKHLLEANLELPLFALIGRPPKLRYTSSKILPDELFYEPNKNLNLTSLNNYLAINFDVNYLYKINSSIALGFNYRLTCKAYSEPERICIISNSLLAKLQFNISH